eukprot:8623483-Prorocentrum_lima.AAC.1
MDALGHVCKDCGGSLAGSLAGCLHTFFPAVAPGVRKACLGSVSPCCDEILPPLQGGKGGCLNPKP